MAKEPDADRVVHDHLLESSGEPYETYIWDDGDGTITEEVSTETHSYYYTAETGELQSIEGKE